MPAPLVFEVKGNSLDDGPGIRTVVFFKGCPLACAWCHNPEGLRHGPELAFDEKLCVGALACLGRCKEGALDRQRKGFVVREKCSLCFDCVEACPSGALSRVGRALTAEEVLAKVKKDLPFFSASGGGVTLSGGEPTMHLELAAEVARGAKKLGVHVLLETCGQFELSRFERELYPHLDLIYYDLKLFDSAGHQRLCGTANRRILENFAALHRRQEAGGVELLPRIPLVPGMTATKENLCALAAFLKGLGAGKVALLPYNPLWPEKGQKLGAAASAFGPLGRFMSRDELAECRGFFSGFQVDGLPAC